MKRNMRILLTLISIFVATLPGFAQKKITPVDNDPTKPQQPTLHYYDKHGNPLNEPVLFLAELDTVTKVNSGPVYPLLQSVSVGVNFFDAIMKLAGQTHQSYDVWASLSLHNWFEPIVEFGIGFADNHPDEGNFRYKGKPSFYGKIGINYNFLYKSNPDYQVYLGLRGGYSSFSYDITDITINSSYWDQTNRFSLTDQKAHAFYGEVVAGIKVMLWKNISMGWNLRYRHKFKVSDAANSTPWFIPGCGAGASLGASFSLIYTLPLHKTKEMEQRP
ncbi:MAG: hypothetical protein K2J82_01010 [Muribaculaceae bacterium]|nr:hypothetical protein [Muribaculaceae bacterium]